MRGALECPVRLHQHGGCRRHRAHLAHQDRARRGRRLGAHRRLLRLAGLGHGLAVGPADVGYVLGMGSAAHLGTDLAISLCRGNVAAFGIRGSRPGRPGGRPAGAGGGGERSHRSLFSPVVELTASGRHGRQAGQTRDARQHAVALAIDVPRVHVVLRRGSVHALARRSPQSGAAGQVGAGGNEIVTNTFWFMGGYARYVWPCFALALLVLAWNLWSARRYQVAARLRAVRALAAAAAATASAVGGAPAGTAD